jgi:signal transduction histidine kinase
MRSSVEFAANHFSDDFDHDLLTRTYAAFSEPNPGGSPDVLARRYEAWIAAARDPHIIRNLYFVAPGSVALQRLDVKSRSFVAAEWPPALAGVRSHLAGMQPWLMERIPPVVPEAPALVVRCGSVPVILPVHQGANLHRHLAMTQDQAASVQSPPPAMERQPMVCPAFTIVELDRERLLRVALPELTRRYFGHANGGDYQVAIVDGDSGQVFFRSDRWPVGHDLRAEISVPIFRLRMPHFAGGMMSPPPRGPWSLLVRYRGGSLAAAVAAARRRNLAVALAILAVLGGSAGTLMVMLRRAQRLQQQQLEFVAGITHELNTPLAALSAAGQNLADGIIADPAEVSRYGGIVVKEGKRLNEMVEQVLDYAGMQSGRRAARSEEVELGAVIADAIEQCRWMAEEKAVRVERDLPRDLPIVSGDAAALTRAIQNLLANAIRHGGDAGMVKVSASSHGGSVSITVEDEGRGIAPPDLPHVFEPFFRGADAGRVRGSGLGLTIVRQIVEMHGGSVNVERGRPRGAALTIVLPARPAVAQAGQIATEHG